MGTRSGDLDPAILEYVCNKEGITLSEMTTILNKKSGVEGVSGVSSDFRDLGDAAAERQRESSRLLWICLLTA